MKKEQLLLWSAIFAEAALIGFSIFLTFEFLKLTNIAKTVLIIGLTIVSFFAYEIYRKRTIRSLDILEASISKLPKEIQQEIAKREVNNILKKLEIILVLKKAVVYLVAVTITLFISQYFNIQDILQLTLITGIAGIISLYINKQ